MKISKKAEYALRAVLAMSRSAPGSVFSIQMLSTEEGIPLKFLEQILLVLRKGGLLHSRRGAGGGYQLARAVTQITLGEVVELIDGPLQILPGSHGASPGLAAAFQELKNEIQQRLGAISLADIVQREQARGAVSFDI